MGKVEKENFTVKEEIRLSIIVPVYNVRKHSIVAWTV